MRNIDGEDNLISTSGNSKGDKKKFPLLGNAPFSDEEASHAFEYKVHMAVDRLRNALSVDQIQGLFLFCVNVILVSSDDDSYSEKAEIDVGRLVSLLESIELKDIAGIVEIIKKLENELSSSLKSIAAIKYDDMKTVRNAFDVVLGKLCKEEIERFSKDNGNQTLSPAYRCYFEKFLNLVDKIYDNVSVRNDGLLGIITNLDATTTSNKMRAGAFVVAKVGIGKSSSGVFPKVALFAKLRGGVGAFVPLISKEYAGYAPLFISYEYVDSFAESAKSATITPRPRERAFSDLKGGLTHECGHFLHYQVGFDNMKNLGIFLQYTCDDLASNAIEMEVSQYALAEQDGMEFVAEVFQILVDGKEKLSEWIINLYLALNGPVTAAIENRINGFGYCVAAKINVPGGTSAPEHSK
ncbi:MAG: hypothetical protein LBI61_02120 [Puniceicoccales bacterium]|nr:hypothetical protein [Puniceicoccales bacterium]